MRRTTTVIVIAAPHRCRRLSTSTAGGSKTLIRILTACLGVGILIGHDGVVQILGITEPGGDVVFTYCLQHGDDPHFATYPCGYAVTRALNAARGPDGDIDLTLLVEPVDHQHQPSASEARDQDQDLVRAEGEVVRVRVRQRIAAYVLVTSTGGIPATQYSDKTGARGLWGLPGGGIDEGEEPRDSVLREIAEETSQRIELGELTIVQSGHWIGRAPNESAEDFHTVRLVYRGSCPAPTDPVVAEVDGTTQAARWVPQAEWRDLAWTVGWREILDQLT